MKRPWSVRALMRQSKLAPALYIVLCQLTNARGVCAASRCVLAKALKVTRPRTISDALTALERARWIRRYYKRQGLRSYLRVVVSPVLAHQVGRASDPPDERASGRPSRRPTLAKASSAGVPRLGRAPGTMSNGGATAEHPSAREERKRMAAIRAAREAREREESQLRVC
jgi:hypothetical protein